MDASAKPDFAWVEPVLADMTLDEKIGQLVMGTLSGEIVTGPKAAPADITTLRSGHMGTILNVVGRDRIDAAQRVAVEESRLGIPLVFCLDVIHGYHTAFPVPIAEAGAFDEAMWRETAQAAAREARAEGIQLTFTPMVDVARDPRWGRIVEGPGEDGWLAARFGRAKVEGLQGDDPAGPGRLAATAKHFVAYGGVTAGRDYASVEISDRLLHETYLPAFKACVEAGVAAIMPAFHDLGGMPMTAHKALMTDLVRDSWGFDGVYISDYGAVGELMAHGIAGDTAEASAAALKAGLDIDMMSGVYAEGLAPALERGLISMADLDGAVRRVLRFKARLGLKPKVLPKLPKPTAIQPPRELARVSGEASITLLTNPHGTLPLSRTGGPIALVGPFVDAPDQLLGPWGGLSVGDAGGSLAQGVRTAFPDREIRVAPVMEALSEGGVEDQASIAAAVEMAKACDVILVTAGEPRERSAEAASRTRPGFWGAQGALVAAMLALGQTLGKPVVLLIAAGRPIIETDMIMRSAAALMLWYPGSEAGAAVGNILSGKVSPRGRLPVSWPLSIGQIPVYFGERPTGRPNGVDQTFSSRYVDSANEPLFPFGHGLSYSKFTLGAPVLSRHTIAPGGSLEVSVSLRNDGTIAATGTVFLFVRDRVASVSRPLLELRGFAQAMLDPGASEALLFTLDARDLAFWQGGDSFAAEPGDFEVQVGLNADRKGLMSASFRLESGTEA